LDYFEVMGLERTASQPDIKKAYRRLAGKYHPDRNKAQDAHERFQKIQQAYNVLSDPIARKRYIEAEYTTVIDPRAAVESFWHDAIYG